MRALDAQRASDESEPVEPVEGSPTRVALVALSPMALRSDPPPSGRASAAATERYGLVHAPDGAAASRTSETELAIVAEFEALRRSKREIDDARARRSADTDTTDLQTLQGVPVPTGAEVVQGLSHAATRTEVTPPEVTPEEIARAEAAHRAATQAVMAGPRKRLAAVPTDRYGVVAQPITAPSVGVALGAAPSEEARRPRGTFRVVDRHAVAAIETPTPEPAMQRDLPRVVRAPGRSDATLRLRTVMPSSGKLVLACAVALAVLVLACAVLVRRYTAAEASPTSVTAAP